MKLHIMCHEWLFRQCHWDWPKCRLYVVFPKIHQS